MHHTIEPIEQTGHICKPTALATTDRFYATQYGFSAIPLNKRTNPLMLFGPQCAISMRQLAKTVGSAQGELLEMRQAIQLAELLGYQIHIVHFDHRFELFQSTIQNAVDKKQLIFAAFAVDTAPPHLGQPTTQPDEEDKNEHAAVLYGYEGNVLFFCALGQKVDLHFSRIL